MAEKAAATAAAQMIDLAAEREAKLQAASGAMQVLLQPRCTHSPDAMQEWAVCGRHVCGRLVAVGSAVEDARHAY